MPNSDWINSAAPITATPSLTDVAPGGAGSTATWGSIGGSIAAQADLQTALSGKINKAGDTGIGALTIASSSGITFDSGAGYSSYVRPNNLGFNRAGSSYITQDGIGGSIIVKTSNVSLQDTTAFTINANGSVSFMSSISAGAGTFNSTLTAKTLRSGQDQITFALELGRYNSGAPFAYIRTIDTSGGTNHPVAIIVDAYDGTVVANLNTLPGLASSWSLYHTTDVSLGSVSGAFQVSGGGTFSKSFQVLGNVLQVGPITAVGGGLGGSLRLRDDSGTSRYLLGFLGTVGATSFTLRDLVANADRLTINSSGVATFGSNVISSGYLMGVGIYTNAPSNSSAVINFYDTTNSKARFQLNSQHASSYTFCLTAYDAAGNWIDNILSVANAAGSVINFTAGRQVNVGGNLTVSGASGLSAVFGIYSGNATNAGALVVDAPTANASFLSIKGAGFTRWALGRVGTSNDFNLGAFDASGALVDVVMSVGNAAGGAVVFSAARPVSVGTFTAASAILGNTTWNSGNMRVIDSGSLGSLGAVHPGGLVFVTGISSPNNGRLFIGDGTGWDFRIASRTGGVTTDRFTFTDYGRLTVTDLVIAPNGFYTGAGVFSGNRLEQQGTNGLAEIAINYHGYNDGTTQFRDLSVYDGKQNLVARFSGSNKQATFYGNLSVGGLIQSNGTTSPNLHLDPSAGANAIYLNYYQGSGGVNFCNGANGVVASINSAGALTATQGTFVANDAYIAVRGGGAASGLILESGPDKSAYLWQYENAPLYIATNNTTRLTIAADGTATFAKNLQATQQRLGLGTYNGNDGDSFTTRALKGCHFGRISGVASAPDMGSIWNYLHMPEVNDGSYSHTTLAISTDGEARIGYGLVSATPTWAVVYTSKNIGTNAAALQAAVASLNAPMVGTAAQRNAFVPVSGTTPYWYVTDENDPSDGQPGRMYQWYSGTWNAAGQQPIVAGRITAGVISAGAVGAQALAGTIVMADHVLRSTAYTTGTSSTPGNGFKIVGGTGASPAFLVTYMDGTSDYVMAEFGGNVKIGGLKAAVIANRVTGNLFYRYGAGTLDIDIPEGIVEIEVTLQAAGGNGFAGAGFGGSGGQYIRRKVSVKPHNKYRFTIGGVGSNTTFAWVSFDGTSGFTSDSAWSISAACGVDGGGGLFAGTAGANSVNPYETPEGGWDVAGAVGGDSSYAGSGIAAGRGGYVGLKAGGTGPLPITYDAGGGGGASAMAQGGGGALYRSGHPTGVAGAGTYGSGGGSGYTPGAGGPGYGRAKW